MSTLATNYSNSSSFSSTNSLEVPTNSHSQSLETKNLSCSSKCTLFALTLLGISGGIVLSLGALHFFGIAGSAAFFASVIPGSFAVIIAVGGLTWIVVKNCKASRRNDVADDIVMIEPTANPLKDIEVSSYNTKITNVAITYSESLLELYQPEKTDFACEFQPVNEKIKLYKALFDQLMEEFESIIKSYPEDTWSQKSVLEAADRLISVGYTISCLALDDLPDFIDAYEKSEGRKLTFIEALTLIESYQPPCFSYTSITYHYVRGGVIWGNYEEKGEECLILPAQPNKQHTAAFFPSSDATEMGTMQFKWRLLYNDYCNKLEKLVDKKAFALADSRFSTWAVADTEETFKAFPARL